MNVPAKECGICNEEFNEDTRCPRILGCIHTLCTICIDQLIVNATKRCPFCRSHFEVNNATDVMVNHTMLELMQVINLQKISSKRTRHSKDTLCKKRIRSLKEGTLEVSNQHYVMCQEEQKEVEKTIEDVVKLQKYINDENSRIEEDVLPILRNVVSQNKDKVEELDKTKKKLQNQVKEVKKKCKVLENMKRKVDACRDDALKKSSMVMEDAEETNTTIGEWMESFIEVVSEDKKRIHTMEMKVKNMKKKLNVFLEGLSSHGEGDALMDHIPGTSALDIQVQDSPKRMTIETFREMSNSVKWLVKQGKIYAIHHFDGSRRTARISITDDDKLCLHHLREEPLPPNILIIEHRDVMRLVDPSSRLSFLELSAGGSTLGRMYIRLTPDTKGTKHFSFLCTGEMGPSYANTKILKVGNKGDEREWVRFGDYETNNGEGGKGLMSRMKQDCVGGSYKRPWLMGTVAGGWGLGDAFAAQFVILTRDLPEEVSHRSIGIVEEGYRVFTDAISDYPNVNDIVVSDCGMVLPC